MFITLRLELITYTRTSKLGSSHQYTRNRTYVILRCDNCGEIFERLKETMSPKRLNNNYFHCCSNCDSKKFAQQKGVERKFIWDTLVSSTVNISRI